MILCVTPNPAIDRTLLVPKLAPGEIMRASRSIVVAGGKGLNVARAAVALGGAVTCAGFLGGHSGRLFAELAGREGLAGEWTWIAGETRTCVIVIEPAGHDATVINETGPAVSPSDWQRLTAQVTSSASAAKAICLSGSLPPGSDPRDYARLLLALCQAGRPVWADTSGPALVAALSVPGAGIKVNAEEASAIAGGSIARPAEALDAARKLHQRTGGPVVLTLGGSGAVLASAAGSWHAAPPQLRIVSSVGSGDAFFAGLVVALARGIAQPEALRYAVAAGAANALSLGAGQIDRQQFADIFAQTRIITEGSCS